VVSIGGERLDLSCQTRRREIIIFVPVTNKVQSENKKKSRQKKGGEGDDPRKDRSSTPTRVKILEAKGRNKPEGERPRGGRKGRRYDRGKKFLSAKKIRSQTEDPRLREK